MVKKTTPVLESKKEETNKSAGVFKIFIFTIIFILIVFFLNQYLFSILDWVFSFLVII
jgi:hypothetical protein